jgi:hypothetical protein
MAVTAVIAWSPSDDADTVLWMQIPAPLPVATLSGAKM